MAKTVLATLQNRIRALEAEAAQSPLSAPRLDDLAGHYRVVVDDLEADLKKRELRPPTRQQLAKALRDAIEAVLEDAQQGLSYREIYARLIQRRVRVPGADPARNVNAHLSADKHRFARSDNGWVLARWGTKAQREAKRNASLDDRAPTILRETRR